MLRFAQWLVIFIVKAISGIFRRLPNRLQKRIASSSFLQLKVSGLLKTALKKKNNYLERNYKKIFPDGDFESFQLEHSQIILDTLIDELRINTGLIEQIQIEGGENLPKGEQAPIFFSAHTLAPSWILMSIASLDFKLTALFRPADHPAFAKVLKYTWSRFINRAISVENVSDFIQVIKNNESVIIFPDLKLKGGRNSIKIDLCGHLAWTSTFTADIAIQNKRPLIPVFAEKDTDGRVKIRIYPDLNQGNQGKEEMTQTMNDLISAEILKQPSRWQLWNTNRWGR